MADIKQRLFNILIALDQLFGALVTLGAAYPDETPSSYAYRLDQDGKVFGRLFRPAIDFVFYCLLGDVNHCQTAYESERKRYQVPPDFR